MREIAIPVGIVECMLMRGELLLRSLHILDIETVGAIRTWALLRRARPRLVSTTTLPAHLHNFLEL